MIFNIILILISFGNFPQKIIAVKSERQNGKIIVLVLPGEQFECPGEIGHGKSVFAVVETGVPDQEKGPPITNLLSRFFGLCNGLLIIIQGLGQLIVVMMVSAQKQEAFYLKRT
jgi:hypothetical protein